MCRSNKKKYAKVRLYHGEGLLEPGEEVALAGKNAHYVKDVMRAKANDVIVLFDGVKGDWSCKISKVERNLVVARVEFLLRAHEKTGRLTLCISLVKHEIMRNVVRQATEMGVTLIQPIVTEYSVLGGTSVQKCVSWAIEASEQCGRCDIPEVAPVIEFRDLDRLGHAFVLCDETGGGQMPNNALRGKTNLAIIVGPEGGFSKNELEYANGFCSKMSLGSRILKVDTAVVAALAYVNEHCVLTGIESSCV